MKGSNPGGALPESGSSNNEKINEDGVVGGPTIKIKVCHGSNQHHLTVPSQSTFGPNLRGAVMESCSKNKEIKSEVRSGCLLVQKRDDNRENHYNGDGVTFGDLKRVMAQETGLEPKEQRLFFRGKEKEDQEYLHMAGVKDNSKLLLMENSASKEVKLEEVKEDSGLSRGCEAVAEVRADVDKLAEQVAALNTVVYGGAKVANKDVIFLTEMLERQLLKLDGIAAEGEGRVQRKMEVRRVQSLAEIMDDLKARNSAPVSNNSNDVGSIVAPPLLPSDTKVNEE